MYRCQECNAIVSRGVPAHRVITASRPADYPLRPGVNRRAKKHSRDDRGGSGWEIVREAMVCASCAARQRELAPPQRSSESEYPAPGP